MHADTLIPESFLESVVREMSDQSAVAGSARLVYLPSRLRYRALSVLRELVWGILRVSGMGSTFFVRRRILQEMGWFDEGMNEEGIDMSKKLRGQGRFIMLREAAQTSARRYERLGFLRTMIPWMLTVALAYVGLRTVSIEKHIWRVVREK